MDLICPSCQKRVSLEDRFAGQVVRCPLCNGTFQAPALAAAAAPTVAPAPPAVTTPFPLQESNAPPVMMPALELPPSEPVRALSLPPPTTPPPIPPPPSAPPPIPAPLPEEIETPVLVVGEYTKSRTWRLNADFLSWLTPVCVTVLFVLSLFPWYWSMGATRFENLWQLAFGQRLIAIYTFYVVVLFVLAWPLSVLVFIIERRWLPVLPNLQALWPWRAAFVGAALLLPFAFFAFDYIAAHFDDWGNPATVARKLAFRVHLVAVVSCVLQFWLEQRRPANLPPPALELRW